MQTSAYSLNSCVKTLKEIRTQLPNNLEPSVIEMLESAILRLEQIDLMTTDRAARNAAIDDGLRVIGRIVEAGLAIAEAVQRYHG